MRRYISSRHLFLLVVCFSFVAGSVNLVAQRKNDPLSVQVREAIDFMDRNLPDAAIDAWDKVIAMAPKYIPYQYERIICNVMAKRYANAIELLKPIYRDTSLFDRGYQLIGNCYDYLQMNDSAMIFYDMGLGAFPNSGRLHYEKGAAAFIDKRVVEALDWWKKGTLVEPSFATNYYWLAKTYAETSNKIFSAFYAEAFLNLESASVRTREISSLCFKVWKQAIRPGHPDDPINFCSDELLSEISPEGPSAMNFYTAFEYNIALAAFHLAPASGTYTNVTVSDLVDIRTMFIKGWKGAGLDTVYANDLLAWNVHLNDEGRFQEYLWWLYSYGDVKEMNDYFKANEQKYDTFLAWFGSNSRPISKKWCVTNDCK
ncbi:MAG: hypothetical protein HQ472_02725 [Ignavibacteria bacterium]|nr:hypothetical protein [Ignavibacteria bacterium]